MTIALQLNALMFIPTHQTTECIHQQKIQEERKFLKRIFMERSRKMYSSNIKQKNNRKQTNKQYKTNVKTITKE